MDQLDLQELIAQLLDLREPKARLARLVLLDPQVQTAMLQVQQEQQEKQAQLVQLETLVPQVHLQPYL